MSFGSGGGGWLHIYSKSRGLTLYSTLSMPIRKMNSAMRRLMQRFLWIVLRSLWRPRKKQKVKMQIAKHTREITIPTQVMTVRSNSCMPFLYWKGWRVKTIRRVTYRHNAKIACSQLSPSTCDLVFRGGLRSLAGQARKILETWWDLKAFDKAERNIWDGAT